MSSFLHKAYIATLICCLLFLAFIYGVVSAIFHLSPAPDIRIHAVNAYGHLAYLYEDLTDTKNQYTSTMWFEDASDAIRGHHPQRRGHAARPDARIQKRHCRRAHGLARQHPPPVAMRLC